MKYIEKKIEGILSRIVESDFIDILSGHLVFERRAAFCAGVVNEAGAGLDYGSNLVGTITRDQLLDLKACVEKALELIDKDGVKS